MPESKHYFFGLHFVSLFSRTEYQKSFKWFWTSESEITLSFPYILQHSRQSYFQSTAYVFHSFSMNCIVIEFIEIFEEFGLCWGIYLASFHLWILQTMVSVQKLILWALLLLVYFALLNISNVHIELWKFSLILIAF